MYPAPGSRDLLPVVTLFVIVKSEGRGNVVKKIATYLIKTCATCYLLTKWRALVISHFIWKMSCKCFFSISTNYRLPSLYIIPVPQVMRELVFLFTAVCNFVIYDLWIQINLKHFAYITTTSHDEWMCPWGIGVPWENIGLQTHTQLKVELLYMSHR